MARGKSSLTLALFLTQLDPCRHEAICMDGSFALYARWLMCSGAGTQPMVGILMARRNDWDDDEFDRDPPDRTPAGKYVATVVVVVGVLVLTLFLVLKTAYGA